MNTRIQHRDERWRFSLAAVFEYTTLCALVCALSPCCGPLASVYLMLLALALGARQGWAALLMLAAASVSADWRLGSIPAGDALPRQGAVVLLAAAICGWYLLRRRPVGASPISPADQLGSADAASTPLYEWSDSAWHRLR